MCNAHFFSTTTMVARKRLNVTLYVKSAFFLKINLTLLYRSVSTCRPPANRQPLLLPEVFLTQNTARALNCWQVIFEFIPSFLVIDVEFNQQLV
jgi:hypothetical protein